MSDGDGRTSRVSIQLGKPPASSSNAIKKRARPAYGRRHRAGEAHENSGLEDDSDEDQQTYGRHETITSIDMPGVGLDDEREPEGRRSRHSGKRDDGNANKSKEGGSKPVQEDGATNGPEIQDKPVKWGLTINMKGAGSTKDARKREPSTRNDRSEAEGDSTGKERVEKSLDEEALEALAGSRAPKRKHVDSDTADRDPRPEDYQSIPIDDFGATLLRNFGWDGKMRGKVKEVTRHANLTGLGAKNVKGAEDLGAWNQKTVKDSRPVRLDDYRREENKKRQRLEDRHADSYKREREREKARERERVRDR